VHVVVLGADFGGLELSTRLSDEVADVVEVTLIDQSDAFVFGSSKLDVMFGRRTADEVRLLYRDIAKPGVVFRHETILSIDPERKRVVTDEGTYKADVLVVALGADLDPEATAGLVEGGYEFYSPAGAARVREILPGFDSGVAVIGVLGGLFKCPPAPFETAFLLHDFLVRRGVRDAVSIYVVSPLPKPIPISDDTSNAILGMLAERGIDHWPGSLVTRLDPAAKVAHFQDGRQLAYDLFLGIPVHLAPAVVLESGLAKTVGFPSSRPPSPPGSPTSTPSAMSPARRFPVPVCLPRARRRRSPTCSSLRSKVAPRRRPTRGPQPATWKRVTTASGGSTSTSSQVRPRRRSSARRRPSSPMRSKSSVLLADDGGSATSGPEPLAQRARPGQGRRAPTALHAERRHEFANS
jgi:hypothetical protein